MTRLTRFFFVALLLAAAGLGAGDVEAQTIRYTAVNGRLTSDIATCANPANPCRLSSVLGNDALANDTVAVLVSAAGAMVEVTSDLTISDRLDFQLYTNDGSPTAWVAGTLKFSGDLTLQNGGVIGSEGDKVARIIESRQVTITANQTGTGNPGPNLPGKVTIGDGSRVRITQSGTAQCLTFDDLTIAGRTQITATNCLNDLEAVINITNSLTVNDELELMGAAILNVTAAPEEKNLGKAFVAVNSSDGITSSSGKLRLAVAGYAEPNFSVLENSKVYDKKTCFQVRGSGPVELDLEVTTAQYICVSVSSLGAGGTSAIQAGTVNFGATNLDGNLVNEGFARTQFGGALMLTGDLTVDGRWTNNTGGTANPLAYPAASEGHTSKAEFLLWRDATTAGEGARLYRDAPTVAIDSVGWTANRDSIATCLPSRRPGIHLHSSSMIEGDVRMYNIAEQTVPAYQAAKGYMAGDPDADPVVPPTAGTEVSHFAVACQPGLFLMGSGMTTVEGTFRALEAAGGDRSSTTALTTQDNPADSLGGYVYLGGSATNPHNLVLEGDVDISSSLTGVEMANAAEAGTINGCTAGLSSSGAGGNKVIFGGSEFQTVTFSEDIEDGQPGVDGDQPIDRTLMLDALTINKSGGNVEFMSGGAGVNATYLEPLNGTLYTAATTKSLLDVGSVSLTGGTVMTDGIGDVYRTSPSSIIYAGGDHTIGKERGTAGTVTILSGGTVSMAKGSIGTLNLYAGTLKPTGEVTVGTLNVGNTGMLDQSVAKLKHTGLLHYNGNGTRMAGAAWAASDSMPAMATDKRTIRIRQDCGKKDKPTLHVDLNPGYTAVGGHLEVWGGTLDLNGNHLILENREGGEQWVSTGNHADAAQRLGSIINSKAGAAYEDEFEKGDDLFDALAALDEEYSEEKQAELDKAIDALRPSGEAKTSSSGGITVGYLHKDSKKNAKTNLVIWREKQSLPAITVVGGAMPILGYTDGDKMPQVTIASLTIGGDKRTDVNTRDDVGRLQVTGALTMSTPGKLTLNGKENAFGSFMQSGGETTTAAGTATSMSSVVVSGTFSVDSTAKVAFGANGTLSLAGDVMASGKVTVPAGNRTTFSGTKTAQNVSFTSTLGHVTVNSGAGLMLGTDVVQAASAELTLQRGVVSTGDSAWVITNPNIEDSLDTRSSIIATDMGTVKLGNRASFVDGSVSRTITQGNSGTGNVKGGYLFPVGMMAAEEGGRNRYRPLILNFGTDVSPKLTATASSYSDGMEKMWPAEGISAPTVGGTMILDTHADIFWKLEMSDIPALGATVRVAADGLTGVNNPKGLRLIQWDCDGSNPRLAGEFDLSSEGVDAGSVSVNARISGVPNTTMDGVELSKCSVFGIAANHAQNPIGDGPPPATPMANVQLIHNIVGATVDVYVDDVLVADNFAFQSATSLATQIAAGDHMVHVVAATAPDNSNPIATVPVKLAANGMYTVVANGDLTNFNFAMLANARMEAVADNKVEFRIVHGAAGLGEVDLRSLTETGRWANNLSFNEATGYRAASATVHNVELLDGHTQIDVFEVDLGDYINETLVLALSGAGASSAMGLTLMGVDTDGNVFFPQVVTSTAGEELPTEFALKGNYPNPFNPSTQIQFDLPATAEVTVQVIDLLGRMVLRLPAQSVEAGAKRTVELDGSSLASGTYLYRLIADMESGVKVETGRMVLIK